MVSVLDGMQQVVRQVLRARGVRSEFVEVGGQSVHHYALEGQGTGPDVVLVHGLGGSANSFSRVVLPLAEHFARVWVPDLPGHGFSPLYCGGPTCLQNQYDVLRAYLDTVVRAPAYVVGNSLGGAMSLQLAADVPDQVRALALIAPAGADVGEERLKALLESFDVRTLTEAREMTRRLFHRPPRAVLLLAHELRRFYGAPAVRALVQEALGRLESLRPEVLAQVRAPTLLLWGQSERLLPYEGVDYFRKHLPHADVRVVPGFGHVPQVERPGELVAHLVGFAHARQASAPGAPASVGAQVG